MKARALNLSFSNCLQDSVRICTEEGPRLHICPEKRYSEDFEPYESVDMEVESRRVNDRDACLSFFRGRSHVSAAAACSTSHLLFHFPFSLTTFSLNADLRSALASQFLQSFALLRLQAREPRGPSKSGAQREGAPQPGRSEGEQKNVSCLSDGGVTQA